VDCWTVWSGAQGTFLLIPVDETHVYGYASTTRGGAAGGDPRWLEATFAGFPEPVATTVATLLEDPGRLYHAPVEEVRCQRWSRGRLALMGDAAHATAPVWAQGATMALEDGLVLAELLAARDDWSGVGAEFEGLRRPRGRSRPGRHRQDVPPRRACRAGCGTWLRPCSAPGRTERPTGRCAPRSRKRCWVADLRVQSAGGFTPERRR
jgi:2-polyprenyl-6-methoxyphenol hydroxylase-like FAD-dependent oxidoreductase